MFQLKLTARRCISCGICMDVCRPRAIAMRIHRAATVEGERTHEHFDSAHGRNPAPRGMMTFPYLAVPERCDGCEQCINQCPADALRLVEEPVGAM